MALTTLPSCCRLKQTGQSPLPWHQRCTRCSQLAPTRAAGGGKRRHQRCTTLTASEASRHGSGGEARLGRASGEGRRGGERRQSATASSSAATPPPPPPPPARLYAESGSGGRRPRTRQTAWRGRPTGAATSQPGAARRRTEWVEETSSHGRVARRRRRPHRRR